jgi:hypothetical protein
MTYIDGIARQLHARMQLAANEALAALSDMDLAHSHAEFYESEAWQRRMQKAVARVQRAQARLDAARAAYRAHHDATCEGCALERVTDQLTNAIIADHVVEGEVPQEERN